LPGYIEDRWFKKGPADPKTGKPTRVETTLHGKGKRYKVTGIPGVRSRSFDKLTGPQGAQAWKAKAQHESTKGEFIDPRDGNMLLREYVESTWWPSLKADPATLETIKSRVWTHVLPKLGEMKLRDIKAATLRVWVKDLEQAVAPGTAFGVWGYLSNILTYAVDDERISRNPCKAKTLKAPVVPEQKARAWTRERVFAVQAKLHERYRILVDIAVGAGLRQGEAFALDVDLDIDEAAELIHIRRQVKRVASKLVFAPPKTGRERTVPLPRHLAAQIRHHKKAFPPQQVTLPWGDPRPGTTKREVEERKPRTHNLLVTNLEGGAIRAWSFNQHYWKRALAAAGVIPPAPPYNPKTRSVPYGDTREFGFHALRHTYASVQLDARESVVAVSKWLGHKDPSITLRVYAHFMPEADGRGRKAMDAWFAPSKPEPKKISLDSPWITSPPTGQPPLKVFKAPRQRAGSTLRGALNGVPEGA
jgi:integrase